MGNVVLFLIRSGIIDLGAFCVELWSFFVSKRISIPMSYISLAYKETVISSTSKMESNLTGGSGVDRQKSDPIPFRFELLPLTFEILWLMANIATFDL